MKENKVTAYLAYAIGEIILVVIGILIAVSLNNLNTQRKLQKSQYTYLIALKTEFEENQKKLEQEINTNNYNLSSARELSAALGSKTSNISVEEFQKLVMGTINAEVQYRPSNGVIVEIISSGKLELFEDDSLRFLISGWEGELQKVRFQEKDELEVQRIKLFNMANKHVNFREMARGYRQNIFELDRSDFKSSENELLISLEFDNHVTTFIASSYFLNNRYEYLYDIQQKLIDRVSQIQKTY